MQYDLVFEGGGAKGGVFVGALQEFKARGHTAGRLIGTSAGAITATLMAAGYEPEEMLQAVNEKLPNGKPLFSALMDIPEAFQPEDVRKSLTYELFKKVDILFIPQLLEGKVDERIFECFMQIDAYREVFSFVERGLLNNAKRLKTIRRIKRLADTMTQAHDRLAIEAHEKEVCRLPARGYGTTEFDMSDARLQALINAGRKAMKDYFDRQDADM